MNQLAETEIYHFHDATRSVYIKDPRIPSPWINYLSNGNFHAFVSQAGGGFGWWKSPLVFRLTRYRHHHQPTDSPGFYLYIREDDGTIWSPALRPTQKILEKQEVQHQPGMSTFTGTFKGLTVTFSLFVAQESDALIWDLRFSLEQGQNPRKLNVYAYVELSQFHWHHEQLFGYYLAHMAKVFQHEESGAVVHLFHHEGHPRIDEVPLVFLASSEPVVSYCGQRLAFLGPYGDEAAPLAIQQGNLGNVPLHTGEGCLASHIQVDVNDKQIRKARFMLGVSPGGLVRFQEAKMNMSRMVNDLTSEVWCEKQKDLLAKWWDSHLCSFSCALPEIDIQRQMEIWSPINCIHTARYSRGVSTVAPGFRGFGFRDTCQDMLAIAPRNVNWALSTFEVLLTHQFADGHAVHTFYPEERQDPSLTVHSDDHLWLSLLAYAIACELGNGAFLNKNVAYLHKDKQLSGNSNSASIWEHLLAACRFTENHLGANGLPLTLKSDWNDIIGRFAPQGKGESVFAAQQYVYALNLLEEIAVWTSRNEDYQWLRVQRERQQRAILKFAWDGSWWRRATRDNGEIIGAKGNIFGELWLNSQTWAIMSGTGDREQWIDAMNSVAERLDTGMGLKKLDPGFKTYPDTLEPFSGYGPGCGENGAIFCHANAWAIIAEALLRRPEKAWKYFTQMMPDRALKKAGLQRYRGEPYAWASNIVGPENPEFGWANVTHITGTAAWMDVAATQYLLGLRPKLDGLLVDPVLPSHWQGFTASRSFRNCTVTVNAIRKGPLGYGVKQLQVDGVEQSVDNPMLTPKVGQRQMNVRVELG